MNMNEIELITKRLKQAIDDSGLSFVQLAERTGIPKSTLQRWATGQIKRIPVDSISVIASVVGVSAKWIMGWDEPRQAIQAHSVVPIVGKIPAGYPVLAAADILGYQVAPVADTNNYFYLRVSGDSMINKGIIDGCLVLIEKCDTAENGQIVACRVNGDEATLKIFQQKGDTVFLVPANPNYDPIIVPAKDFETGEASIYGIVKFIVTEV